MRSMQQWREGRVSVQCVRVLYWSKRQIPIPQVGGIWDVLAKQMHKIPIFHKANPLHQRHHKRKTSYELLALDMLPQQIKVWLKPKFCFHYHLPSKDPFKETPVQPETVSTPLWSQNHTQLRSEGPCLVQSPARGSPLLHSENPAATFPLLSNVRAS